MDHSTQPGAKTPTQPEIWRLAAVVGAVAFVHAAWWLLGDTVVAHGNLVDGDGYARLLRVDRLLETGQWFDSSLPRANWPYGGSLHWTRLFDVLLIALALPLMPLIGQDPALYWSGAVISPLLHMVTAVVLAWAARPLIGRTAALIAGALTAVQFGVLGYATIGHADHHVLFGLIAVCAFGFAVRALTAADDGGRQALATGGVLAVGYWVGMEMQITTALVFAVIGLKWVLEGDKTGRGSLTLVFNLALGLVAGLVAAVLIERGPQGFLDPQYDRVSIVQLTLAAGVLAFWAAVSAARRRGWVLTGVAHRLAAAALGAAAVLAVMWLLYPKVFVDPLKDFNPIILRIFEDIAEYAPITDVPHFLLYTGVSLIAGPWALWRLKTETGGKRWAWGLLAASSLVYLVFALNWIRWSLYVGLFMTVALADLALFLDDALNKRFVFPSRVFIKAAVISAVLAGPLGAGALGVYAQQQEAKAQAKTFTGPGDPRPCPVQALSGFLNKPPWSDRPRAILASANFGAELLYRTRHRVTATLHHPNAQGILDSVNILGGIDEADILGLIRKRQIDLILICRFSGYEIYIFVGGDEDILYLRLKDGDPPAWLKEVGLPSDLAKAFRLFEVAGR